MAQKFRQGLGRIVLDPGHGGKDPGAVGIAGLREKRVALDIALRTRRVLRRVLPGNRVYLTRTTDRYISLSDRTTFANEYDADIFVSIHANSARSRRVHGIETYLLSEASSRRALKLAARESGTTIARMTDLQKILNDLGLRSKVAESQQLAQRVQQAMLSRLRPSYRGVRNLGVKRGPFYVLLGAQMPSILVEVAFISNRREARRMNSPKYRQALAEGIARGIMQFVGAGYRKSRK
ncbi:MAG: N-acetylmuramoyl-L-alanine amidase [Nitrospinae bacterium]|nr:N-acetylmuramoyl-L-alanine amidase [Nitrospinota bacterium]